MNEGSNMRSKIFVSLITLLLTFVFFYACEHDKRVEPERCGDGEISASDAIWTHGRADLQNSKRAAGIRQKGCFTGPKTTPQVQWSFAIGGPGSEAPPVIGDDGTIYLVGEYPGETTGVGLRNSGLMAVSSSGSLKWFFKCPEDLGPNGIAAVYEESVALGKDGTIYYNCVDSGLYAIRPNDGSAEWHYMSNITAMGVGANSKIYAGYHDTVFCFNSDGSINWRFVNDGSSGYCSQISLSRNYIFCAFNNGVMALDYNGHKRWFYPVNYENDGGKDGILVDKDENLYLKTNQNNIKSWDRNGNLRWEGSVSFIGGMTQPVLRGDYLYFGAFGALYRLDKLTGTNITVVAEAPAYLSQFAAPLIDDVGTLFIVSDGGPNFDPYVMAASETGTTTLWTKQITEANSTGFHAYLALSPDGTIYFATTNVQSGQGTNKLYAIR